MSDDFFDEMDEEGFADPFGAVDEDADSSVRTLEEFEEEVARRMKILLSRKQGVELRVDAAQWLGDSGAPKAVEALLKVYKKEKDKRVKSAAAYALGQFRALDKAIKRDSDEQVQDALGKEENQWVVQLLTEIAMQDKRGKPLTIPTRMIVLLEGVLAVILVVLIVANLGKPESEPRIADLLQPTSPVFNTISPVRPVVTQIQNNIGMMRTDVTLLMGEVDAIAAGNLLNCGLNLNNPPTVEFDTELRPDYPIVNALVMSYNAQQAVLTQARGAYDTACARGLSNMIASEQNTIRNNVQILNTSLTDMEERLLNDALNEINTEELELQATATVYAATAAAIATSQSQTQNNQGGATIATQEPEVTPTPIDTDTPQPTLTPTLDFRTHIGAFYSLIDDTRIKNNLLRSHLQAIRDRNDLAGCRQPAATIQADYVLPPEDAAASPDLKNVVEQINAALPLSRTGWSLFTAGCADGSIRGNVTTGLTIVDTVEAALQNAENTLATFR